MISLWMIYFLMILMGIWMDIYSAFYTSVYSAFFGLVLGVTLMSVVLRSNKTIQDIRFMWFVFFALTLMNQFGAVLELYSDSPYFDLYMAAIMLIVFVKTVIAPIDDFKKFMTSAIAFLAVIVTRLTELVAIILFSEHWITDYFSELLVAIAEHGGAAHFLSISRIFGSVATIRFSIISGMFEFIVPAASSMLIEGVTFALLVAAIVYAVMWQFERRNLKEEAKEREQEEAIKLEEEAREREQKEAERLVNAKNLIASAAVGDAKAQYELGMLFIGNGNHKDAIQWFEKAAESGDIESKYELGKLYYQGSETTERDLEKAYVLLKEAAIADHTEAQFLLGCMYFGAEVGGEPDYPQAVLWFGKAAGNGHVKSMGMLAQVHTMGDEFPEADAHLAIKLMKKMAHDDPNEDMPLEVIYNGLNAQEEATLERAWEKRNNEKKQRDTETDELLAELYWLNESIKQKRKFLADYADNWDWRNEETQKALRAEVLKSRELADKIDSITGR